MEIKVELIKELIEKKCGLYDIAKKTRKRPYPELRFTTYQLCKDFIPKITLSEIGDGLGGRNHATVIHGLKMFDDLKNQKSFKDNYKIYSECFKELVSLSGDDNFEDFTDALKLKKIKDYYRIKFIQLMDKQHRVINRQQKQIFKLSNKNIFNEISELGDSDFKELEVRINDFLKMKKNVRN